MERTVKTQINRQTFYEKLHDLRAQTCHTRQITITKLSGLNSIVWTQAYGPRRLLELITQCVGESLKTTKV